MPDFRVALLHRLGFPVTKENLRFLSTWQAFEGGATKNAATYNWWNSTRGSQYPRINSVGVRAYPNFATGVRYTAETLNNGRYPDIMAGLKAGNPYATPGVADDLSVWVSGTPNKGLRYAKNILGSAYKEPNKNASKQLATSVVTGVLPKSTENPAPDPNVKRQALMSYIMASNAAIIGGKPQPDFAPYAQLIQSESRANAFGGTIKAPVSPKTGVQPGIASAKTSGTMKRVLEIAHQQIGKPYVWGAESPAEGGFDCSGLIDYSLRQAGVKLPGRLTTWSMAKLGESVKGKGYEPGDWIITNSGKHVVMYVGNGKVIAAPRRGEVVQYQNLDRFRGDIVDVRRIKV